MVTPEAIAKVKERALARGVKIYMLEVGKRYVALSASNDELAYEITLHGRGERDISCTCPGATYQGVCKHIGATLIRLETDRAQARETLERDIQDLFR